MAILSSFTRKDMCLEKFAYENLRNPGMIESDDWSYVAKIPAINDEYSFTFFCVRDIETDKCNSVGWKAHLSIDENDMSKAWDVVAPIITKYNISIVKGLRPGYSLKELSACEKGKQITIYCCLDMTRLGNQWGDIFSKIEVVLINEGVKPTDPPEGCRRIANSRFFSYRNDAMISSSRRVYLSARDSLLYEISYNPLNIDEDLFQDIELTNSSRNSMLSGGLSK